MNRIAGAALFGIALAVVLAFGMPGQATASVNHITGYIVPVEGLDITLGPGGIGIGSDRDSAERERELGREQERAYTRDREAIQRDRDALRRDEQALDRDTDYNSTY